MTTENAEIKKEIGIDKPDGTKLLPKQMDLLKKFWTQPLLLEQLREGMKEKKICRNS